MTLRIVFTPQAVGEHVGALDLTHNDSDVRSPLRVALWGVGATGEPKRYYYFKDHLGSVRATVNVTPAFASVVGAGLSAGVGIFSGIGYEYGVKAFASPQLSTWGPINDRSLIYKSHGTF